MGTFFGLLVVTAILIFYALGQRRPWIMFAVAGACAAASVYGFLQGAWPVGVIEAVWTIIVVRKWWSLAKA